MLTWKKAAEDSDTDWILLSDNDSKDIIATITVSENPDSTYNVEAVCKKIRYTGRFENIDKDRLKTVMNDLKKFVAVENNHLREENQRPTVKKIYKMIDSIPMWTHIKNGTEKIKIKLIANDYGKFSEMLGNRILDNILQRGGILQDMFPDIEIISINSLKKFKILERAKIGLGDIVLELSCKKDGVFGKKIVIFEIKHGKIMIEQNQLRRYCSMILNPGDHFKKADEVRIIYMLFDNIDTMKASATYSIKEIGKEFAEKVIAQEPVGEEIYNS